MILNISVKSKEENKAGNVLMDGFSTKIFASKRHLVYATVYCNIYFTIYLPPAGCQNNWPIIFLKYSQPSLDSIMCISICIMMTEFTHHVSFQTLGFHYSSLKIHKFFYKCKSLGLLLPFPSVQNKWFEAVLHCYPWRWETSYHW